MVVHEDNEEPVEVALIRKPLLEKKPFVIVKNHVREIINYDDSTSSVHTKREGSPPSSKKVQKEKRITNKRHKTKEVSISASESEENANNDVVIDSQDLQELKLVYTKCKEVMRKIETKYGHLLDLESEVGPSSSRKRKANTAELTDSECDCKLNKKIVFDEDGQQKSIENVSDKHICVKKVKQPQSEMKTRSKTIAIEYTEKEVSLSDNLQELGKLLQNPNLEKPLRNKIVDKIRMLKQDYVNEIKFNKPALIEKLKTNPDEVLDFKGTNLSSIIGYL